MCLLLFFLFYLSSVSRNLDGNPAKSGSRGRVLPIHFIFTWIAGMTAYARYYSRRPKVDG
jgi:hypothetical protein